MLKVLTIFFLLLLNSKLFSFEIPNNLEPVDFNKISFNNKIFKNYYLKSDYFDFEKFYPGNSLVYGSTPSRIYFRSSLQKNEACYEELSPYGFEFCAFVFFDEENYYWSTSNDIKNIYAKAIIMNNEKIDFMNSCDLSASPVNSPISNFFKVGLKWSVETMDFLPAEMFFDLDVEPIIKTCEKEIELNPEIGRNYTNLYHLKKYYYKSAREKNGNERDQLNDDEMSNLIKLLDSAINVNQPDYRAYYHMGLLNRDGFEYDWGKFQRPKDERFSQETNVWMNYFFLAFNEGNHDVLIDMIKHIQKNYLNEGGFLGYFNWYINELGMWKEDYVQNFFMNFIHELDRSRSFENYLFEKGNEEQLKNEVKSRITKHSDEYMLVIFSDYILDKFERNDYVTEHFYKTIQIMHEEGFLPSLNKGWKNEKAFSFTKYFTENPTNMSPRSLMYLHDMLRWHYEYGRGTSIDLNKSLFHLNLGLEIAQTNNYADIDFKSHISRLERKSLVNVPDSIKIDFYCTDDIWVDTYYLPMGQEYGIMAVETALSMDVFNNVYAMEGFKSNTPYLCNFFQDYTILKSKIRFMTFYNNKSIVSIALDDGTYLYSAINY